MTASINYYHSEGFVLEQFTKFQKMSKNKLHWFLLVDTISPSDHPSPSGIIYNNLTIIASEKKFQKYLNKNIGIDISEQCLAIIYLKALYNPDKNEYVMYQDIIPYNQDLLINQNMI